MNGLEWTKNRKKNLDAGTHNKQSYVYRPWISATLHVWFIRSYRTSWVSYVDSSNYVNVPSIDSIFNISWNFFYMWAVIKALIRFVNCCQGFFGCFKDDIMCDWILAAATGMDFCVTSFWWANVIIVTRFKSQSNASEVFLWLLALCLALLWFRYKKKIQPLKARTTKPSSDSRNGVKTSFFKFSCGIYINSHNILAFSVICFLYTIFNFHLSVRNWIKVSCICHMGKAIWFVANSTNRSMKSVEKKRTLTLIPAISLSEKCGEEKTEQFE